MSLRIGRRIRHIPTGFAVIGIATAITGCGSSGKPPSPHADFLAYSKCMRAHGVSGFPDPSPGGGIRLQIGSGVNPSAPAFKSAHASCRRLLPGGGPPMRPSAQARAQLLAVSQCMRRHGVPDFPDPTTTPPSDPGAFGGVLDENGVVLAIPKTVDVQAPAFKSAAALCKFNG